MLIISNGIWLFFGLRNFYKKNHQVSIVTMRPSPLTQPRTTKRKFQPGSCIISCHFIPMYNEFHCWQSFFCVILILKVVGQHHKIFCQLFVSCMSSFACEWVQGDEFDLGFQLIIKIHNKEHQKFISNFSIFTIVMKNTHYLRSIFVVIAPFLTMILSRTMLSPKNMIYTIKELKFSLKKYFSLVSDKSTILEAVKDCFSASHLVPSRWVNIINIRRCRCGSV